MIEFMNGYLPQGVGELLLPLVYKTDFKFGLGIFFITSFLIASNGINSIIRAADKLYHIKASSWLYRRVKAIFILMLLVSLITFMLLVPVFGNKIVTLLSTLDLTDNLYDKVHAIYQYLKWPLTVFFIFFIVKLIYVLVPSKRIKSSLVTKGALFTTLGWLIITVLFSQYIDNISRYHLFYGSLANVIILMLWIYVLVFIFVMGLMYNVHNETD